MSSASRIPNLVSVLFILLPAIARRCFIFGSDLVLAFKPAKIGGASIHAVVSAAESCHYGVTGGKAAL